jgi:hypothetical protein
MHGNPKRSKRLGAARFENPRVGHSQVAGDSKTGGAVS